MTYSKNAPFRADVVGSYLRPDELKQARAGSIISSHCGRETIGFTFQKRGKNL